MDVSICVPFFNEVNALRDTILELKDAFDKLPYKYEILVIDDGSTDGSIQTIEDLDVRIIRHGRNLGGGVARLNGIRHAKAPIIFQTDADGTYPCEDIPRIMEAMKTADMVIAARRKESARDWHILRVFMKSLLKFLASVLAGHPIPDLNSGMRAYKKRLALRYAYLYPKGHSIMSTMTLAFISDDLKVSFVDIDYRVRVGKSSFRPIKDTYNYFLTIIRTIIYFDPLRLIIPASMFLFALATSFSVRDIYVFSRINSVTVILFLSALLVALLGTLSDQFSRLSKQIAELSSNQSKHEEWIEEVERAK